MSDAAEIIQRIWMPPLWEVGDGIIPVDAQAEADDVSYILATPEALAASPEAQALIAAAVEKERERAAGIGATVERLKSLCAWLEDDADNIHFLPVNQVEALRKWIHSAADADHAARVRAAIGGDNE